MKLTILSLRSAAVIGGVLGRAGQRGQERRLEEAKSGKVTWETPPPVAKYIKKEMQGAIAHRREVMGRMQANLVDFNEEELQILQTEQNGEAKSISDAELLNMLADASMEEPDRASEIQASLDAAKSQAAALESEIAEIRT